MLYLIIQITNKFLRFIQNNVCNLETGLELKSGVKYYRDYQSWERRGAMTNKSQEKPNALNITNLSRKLIFFFMMWKQN